MSRSRWMLLGLVGIASALAGALSVRAPGYMDADYYYATARELAEGHGFWEPFLWNYLDNPEGLPHPSHVYWMPLASILAAGSMAAFGVGFVQAQAPFLAIVAAFPAFTAALSLWLTRNPRRAWHAGVLASFPGFFLPFFWTTDTFGLYALLGASALWVFAAAAQHRRPGLWLSAGLLVGFCHLARADGVLLLIPAALALWWARDARGLGWLIAGYGLVMGPWMARTLALTGSVLAPGASRALWLLDYDGLFSFPATLLTPARWWDSGLWQITKVRLEALGLNLQSLLAVNGLVFLAPLMALGAWRLRGHHLVRLASLYLLTLLAVMTLAFPFVGSRGGFFHSSAALMPVLWCLVPVGLEVAVEWGARHRGWNPEAAVRAFALASVVLAAAFTGILALRRLSASHGTVSHWYESQQIYSQVGGALRRLDPNPGVVAVNNPAGFFLATGLEAVVIPNGSPDVLRQVAQRYGVEWVVLDRNRPIGLEGLFEDPGSVEWLSAEERLVLEDGSSVWLLKTAAGDREP